MTPCGAEPRPREICSVSPVAGSRRPSSPVACAVYHTEPSGAGATSWGWLPAGTAYSTRVGRRSSAAAVGMIEEVAAVLAAVIGVVGETGVAPRDLLSRQAPLVTSNSRSNRADGRTTLKFYRRRTPAPF